MAKKWKEKINLLELLLAGTIIDIRVNLKQLCSYFAGGERLFLQSFFGKEAILNDMELKRKF